MVTCKSVKSRHVQFDQIHKTVWLPHRKDHYGNLDWLLC